MDLTVVGRMGRRTRGGLGAQPSIGRQRPLVQRTDGAKVSAPLQFRRLNSKPLELESAPGLLQLPDERLHDP